MSTGERRIERLERFLGIHRPGREPPEGSRRFWTFLFVVWALFFVSNVLMVVLRGGRVPLGQISVLVVCGPLIFSTLGEWLCSAASGGRFVLQGRVARLIGALTISPALVVAFTLAGYDAGGATGALVGGGATLFILLVALSVNLARRGRAQRQLSGPGSNDPSEDGLDP